MSTLTNPPILFLTIYLFTRLCLLISTCRDSEASVSYTMNLTRAVLSQLDAAVRNSVAAAGARQYQSKHGLAVSWNEISFFSGHPGFTPYPVSHWVESQSIIYHSIQSILV